MFCKKYKRVYSADHDLNFPVNISNVISHSEDIYKDRELVEEELCEYSDAQYGIITIVGRNCDRIMININVFSIHVFALRKRRAYIPIRKTDFPSGTIDKDTLQNVPDKVEKQRIVDILIPAKGNNAKAAVHLEITERITGLRIGKYGLNPHNYKQLSNEES